MRITIVNGFFLPMPPNPGGANEKMWWRLARIYSQHGHTVTLISRCWHDWPNEEISQDGVHLIRLPGFDHRPKLWQNLILDACWGWRVLNALPPADILITNTLTLPIFAPYLRPRSGKLVVNLNRYPKGQLRWYRRASRIQVPTRPIAAAAKSQAPELADRLKLLPNPIDTSLFQVTEKRLDTSRGFLKIGFMGRIHPEKGVHTLVRAALILAEKNAFNKNPIPPWQLILRGPIDVPLGGGGSAYMQSLHSIAPKLWQSSHIKLEIPIFNPKELAKAYADLTVFCYPSEAIKGETHGISILEAMASGLPVVASDLPVFLDYLTPDEDSLVFPAGDAQQLADALALLLSSPTLRQRLGSAARSLTTNLDDSIIAAQHLSDYKNLLSNTASKAAL